MTDTYKTAQIEVTELMISIKRDGMIVDAIWDDHKELWLCSVGYPADGENESGPNVEDRSTAMSWCLEEAGLKMDQE